MPRNKTAAPENTTPAGEPVAVSPAPKLAKKLPVPSKGKKTKTGSKTAAKVQKSQSPAKRERELSAENASLHEAITAQAENQQALINQMAARQAPGSMGAGGYLFVGIRNITPSVIGVRSPFPGEQDVHLHATRHGIKDLSQVAIVSYPFWLQLRKGKLYDQGLIMRDDSVLGTTHRAAPPDRPEDLAPNWARNAILPDARRYIESRTEDQLRAAVAEITSETSLRTLWAEVDQKFAELLYERKKVDTDGRTAFENAKRDMPGSYNLIENLVVRRLDEVMGRRVEE